MTDAIIAEGLGKAYDLNFDSSGKSVERESLVEATLRPLMGKRKLANSRDGKFWALRDISFNVKPGDILGIVGRNGSGKSTLLKILAGVVDPTEGRAEINGRMGTLLEVGTGFHPDLSGRENIFLSGAILGMSHFDIMNVYPKIMEFADIGQFIDHPVKYYSSGMYIRLAFSVAVHLRTDILVLDEVMAVGDAEFQKKCIDALNRLVHDGRTVLFVSHATTAILQFCNKGMLLERGKNFYFGEAEDTVTRYLQMIHHLPMGDGDEEERNFPAETDLWDHDRWEGTQKKLITSIGMYTLDGTPKSEFLTGDTIVIEVGYDIGDNMTGYCQVDVVDMLGARTATMHSTHDGCRSLKGGKGILRCIIMDNRLMEGEYSIMCNIGDFDENDLCRWIDCVPNAMRFRILLGEYVGGVGLIRGQGVFAQKSVWHNYPVKALPQQDSTDGLS